MQKIKTLQTVPGDGTMIKPGTELVVGKDISGANAYDHVQSGRAVTVGCDPEQLMPAVPNRKRKTRAPGLAGSDTKPETRG